MGRSRAGSALRPKRPQCSPEMVQSILAPWSTFFVVTATSAATLIGLSFVVITLVMGAERVRRSPDGLGTFSTPTVMHFCIALLVSLLLIAPWRSVVYPSAVMGLVSVYELAYMLNITFRQKRMTSYTPDLSDWEWYSILPFVAYSAMLAGAIGFAVRPREWLFVLAAAVALLIFIGIRNAWDVVTFLAIGGGRDET